MMLWRRSQWVNLRRWACRLAAGVALAGAPSAGFAQSDAATISGRITDPSGQVLSEVRVRVTDLDTGGEQSAQSALEGLYVVRNVRPGRHRMVVERDGFKTIVLDGLTLAVQDVLGRNFVMEIGPVTDSVTVTAGAADLSPAVSTVVDRQFVENLPLNGRSFQSLIQLTPGALVTPAGQGMEGQFSVNGQRTNTNYFTVDGVGVNFATNISVNLHQNVGGTLPALTIGGGTNSFVSVDAMQEFRTQTSSYSPEFGRTPGAQVSIVTRSGTNQWHGTLYDYVRNEALDARNWFNRPPEPQPPLRQHDFGGTLGGPIVRNNSFFFFSYEGLRLRQPRVASGYVYTPETRAAIAPVYQPIVNALPIPNGPLLDPGCDHITRPCRASLTVAYSDPTDFDAYSLRLDQTPAPGLTLFARLSHTPSIARQQAFSAVTSASRNTDLVTAGVTAIRAHVVNDLRVGWSRSIGRVETTPSDADGAVPLPIASLFPAGTSPASSQWSITLPDGTGVGMGTRVSNATRQISVIDTVSLVRGAHHVKVGVDYRHFEPGSSGNSATGLFLTDFSQLQTGRMGTVLVLASEPLTVRMHNWSVFGQDTWQAAGRLTVNYGLRWEINTPPVSVTPGKPLFAVEGIFDSKPLQLAPPGTALWRTRYNNVAPRAGAAYQLTATTILRGGFGLFHDLGYGGQLGNLLQGFPYTRSLVTSVAGEPFDLTNPAFTPPPISTSLSTLSLAPLTAFDPDLQLPVTLQWNTALERELGPNQTLSVTYVGAHGRRLLRPDYVVQRAPGGAVNIRTSATRNAGSSRYAALQTQFRHRLTGGLQALVSYTLASARDTGSDDVGGNSGNAVDHNYAASLSEIQLPPLSPADFDVRHAFSTAVSYEVPAPSLGRVGRAILRDWGVDAIVRASSPPPLNVRIEGVSPEFGVYRSQPDLVPGQPVWLSAPGQPGGKVLNPDAFTVPPWGVTGNLPRNSIRSPFAISQTDLALRRRFPSGRGTSLEFRAEFFNLFNQPMFGGQASPVTLWGRCTAAPCTGRQSAGFGKVADGQTLNQGLGGDPLSGGQDAIYAVGGSRSIQFSLKLRF